MGNKKITGGPEENKAPSINNWRDDPLKREMYLFLKKVFWKITSPDKSA